MADKNGNNQFFTDEPQDGLTPRKELEPPDGLTRAFALETAGKEPVERCEERSAIREVPAGLFVWRMLRPLLILLISALLVWLVGSFAYNYINDNYVAPVESDTAAVKTIEIKTGSSLSRIATLLYEEGIIRNKLVFQLYVDFNDMSSKLQAGTYDLSPGMTIDEIMETLAAGDGAEDVIKIVFTEGMTIEEMAGVLVEKRMFDETERREFLALCNDTEEFDGYSFIAALPDTALQDGRTYLLEGYLFPDTYEFYTDAAPKDVITKLLSRFDEKFTLDFEERAEALGMTVDQVVSLASIVQWEALQGDFKKVSAVFHNRLAIEMPLQSCATLRYVTGVKKLAYSSKELAIESPYNTYKIGSLPIGPISNPGVQAIGAALYPDEEYVAAEYLFFCNRSPDSGELVFAQTLDQHNANKAAYNAAAGTNTYDTTED
jgi:conserved hypothetical protein, YceG family